MIKKEIPSNALKQIESKALCEAFKIKPKKGLAAKVTFDKMTNRK